MATECAVEAEAKTEQQLKQKRPPRLWAVRILNDDFTPMEFVVDLLQTVFAMDLNRATQLMLQVHYEGQALCGWFPRDVAEMKVAQAMQLSEQAGHPLQCVADCQ